MRFKTHFKTKVKLARINELFTSVFTYIISFKIKVSMKHNCNSQMVTLILKEEHQQEEILVSESLTPSVH